ncbi:multicopper oxidase domain-containing protein [Mobilicoccus pelagius]|uniref:Putative oxidoreductase n=1 Tax=Mobilicoccus pelagius NBRC 104925 TaxID=1089455 RepID=H5URC0_9MICO|nr:multicopper oxidase domain-containing protein [Mobilicoccus pelagius]GAB48278.1 putative oxidoreductase [Mobilicoccus pelagius NBRC 104925]
MPASVDSPGSLPVGGPRPTPGPRRRHWPLRDYPSVFWLAAAAAVALVHRFVPESTWLMIHLVLLGALTHAILVWSRYFTDALLKVPASDADRQAQSARIVGLLAGSSFVLVGVPTGLALAVAIGAGLVAVAVVWHGVVLWRMLRGGLPGRFRVCVHYYVAAAACLAVGAILGGLLGATPGGIPDPAHGRFLLAHASANLLGWVGLTILGTLVTFWPTLLHARIDPRADALAREALPTLLLGVAVLVGGALAGVRLVALVGLLAYVVGVLWWGRALLVPLRTRPPRTFAAASVAAALPWALVVLAWLGWILVTMRSGDAGWTDVVARLTPVAGVAAVGVGVQILTGALAHLVPTVLGGGPAVVRATGRVFDRHAAVRLVLVNAGLLFLLLPVPSWVSVTTSLLGLVGLMWFLPLVFVAVRVNRQGRRAVADGEPVPDGEPSREQGRLWSAGQVVAALSALGVAVVLGIGVDPAAAGLASTSGSTRAGQSAVAPTGRTVRAAVSAKDMRFTPATVTVQAGDRLVVDLVNDDPAQVHDLVLGDATSGRLAPGGRAEVDAGVIAGSTQGWCSIAGHRQMGMTFDVVVDGAPPADTADTSAGGAQDHAGHDTTGMHGGTGTTSSAPVTAVPDAGLTTHVDPALAPLPPRTGTPTVHRITLRATEIPLEVAPGVWQTRWTFGDGHVGPTLHGRVGDVFEITLVNEGAMGHSIDFHAGALAPDRPMRTIPPGESLVYRFTAGRAGAWMYHCSTHPMSHHIAAGMAGAVVIEPDDLPAVDRSYVLVQSEAYVAAGADGKAAARPEDAQPIDAAKIAARRPDFVTFNGIANQYDRFPLTAKVGERVRIWAVDTGPNSPSSLHVVGGQFDTVYAEGGYHLVRGKDAFGHTGGGAQALALQPAQGGFVELTFPEAGHYPVVSHVMSDAEIGAHGVVRVAK